jgi:hypothetical protein
MKAEDIQLVHRLWLDITQYPGLDKLHHSDIVTGALERFAHDYRNQERDEILGEFRLLENQRQTPDHNQDVDDTSNDRTGV